MAELTKEELKQPDVVTHSLDRFWNWILDNSKALAALVALIAIAAVVYSAIHFLQRRQERLAQEQFYGAESQYLKLKESYDKAKYADLMEVPEGEKKDPGVKASGDLQKDYGAAIEGMEKVIKDHSGSKAAAQAALTLSSVYLEYQKPDQAIAALEVPAKKLAKNDLLYGLVQLALGTAMASKGDCQRAVEVWQAIGSAKETAFATAEAAVRSGVCFENLNQPDRAVEMYRKASENHSDTAAGQTAKALLRVLEMKQQQKTSQQAAG